MSRKCLLLVGTAILGIIAVSAAEATSHSTWKIQKDTDPFTDETVSVAMTFGSSSSSRSVVVRCKGTEFSAYVNFADYLSNDSVDVRYRLDKDQPVTERWSPSSDGTAVFGRHQEHLARLLMKGSLFVIEAIDYRGVPHRASFKLSGSSDAISPVLEQCGVQKIGLHEKVQGLRLDMALHLDRWGPRGIAIYKQILSSLGKYNGPHNSSIEPEFALVVQDFYDSYIDRCRMRKISGTSCSSLHIFWDNDMKPIMPFPSSIIYEIASGDLKDQAGKLRLGD